MMDENHFSLHLSLINSVLTIIQKKNQLQLEAKQRKHYMMSLKNVMIGVPNLQ